jgi:hypothetical protein
MAKIRLYYQRLDCGSRSVRPIVEDIIDLREQPDCFKASLQAVIETTASM